MGWLGAIWSELLALFVDDARFAVTILLWLAVAWWLLPRLGLPPSLPPLLLFAGLAAILAESAVHRARAIRRR